MTGEQGGGAGGRPALTALLRLRHDRDPAVRRRPARVPDAGPQAHPAPPAREQERCQARARSARGVPQDQEEAPQKEYASHGRP